MAARLEVRESMLEDYELIGGHRMSAAEAARRIGVAKQTVERWRRAGLVARPRAVGGPR